MSGLSAIQVTLDMVRVSWTAPDPAPPRGYRVVVSSVSIDETAQPGTFHDVTITQLGPHTVQVEPLSMHYTSMSMSTQVTVRGEGGVSHWVLG